MLDLYDHQKAALKKMKNGCILCGDVGSGKSRTALAYYYISNGGAVDTNEYVPMNDPPKDLYIITTARKRDTKEWEAEMPPFLLSTHADANLYGNKVVIDSWNNIKKYAEVENAFFIFDEQRVVGSGAWVKAFLKIAKKNEWILLSATPGDTWSDYTPVFIANGFFRNRTEFRDKHVIYNRGTPYPKIDRYVNTGRLLKLRDSILVEMPFEKKTKADHRDVYVSYNAAAYKDVRKRWWDPYKNEPIINAAGFCYVLRKIVNTDSSRMLALGDIIAEHPKVIIFYNFDYELELLKNHFATIRMTAAEWNGHRHEPIPTGDQWAYLVQYTAGAEGWNCTTTDTIIFYSQNYSYKLTKQAAGRIDRINTPYTDLYYFHLKSRAGIDMAINRALSQKKDFNETKYATQTNSKKGEKTLKTTC